VTRANNGIQPNTLRASSALAAVTPNSSFGSVGNGLPNESLSSSARRI
jgi:hypothetical protein